jgi:hypothetical protein
MEKQRAEKKKAYLTLLFGREGCLTHCININYVKHMQPKDWKGILSGLH